MTRPTTAGGVIMRCDVNHILSTQEIVRALGWDKISRASGARAWEQNPCISIISSYQQHHRIYQLGCMFRQNSAGSNQITVCSGPIDRNVRNQATRKSKSNQKEPSRVPGLHAWQIILVPTWVCMSLLLPITKFSILAPSISWLWPRMVIVGT